MKPSPTGNNNGWTTNEERLIIDTAPTLIHTARPDGCLDFFKRWLSAETLADRSNPNR